MRNILNGLVSSVRYRNNLPDDFANFDHNEFKRIMSGSMRPTSGSAWLQHKYCNDVELHCCQRIFVECLNFGLVHFIGSASKSNRKERLPNMFLLRFLETIFTSIFYRYFRKQRHNASISENTVLHSHVQGDTLDFATP